MHLKVVPSFIFIGNMIHLLPVAKAICVGTTKLSVLWLYGDRLFVEYVNRFYLNPIKLFFFFFLSFFHQYKLKFFLHDDSFYGL